MLQEFKKKQILSKAVGAAKKVVAGVKNIPKVIPAAVGLGKDKIAQWSSQGKANKSAGKLAGVLMGPAKGQTKDRYPEGTLIGDAHRESRKKEITEMIKAGKIKEAKEFITKKRQEFDKLN